MSISKFSAAVTGWAGGSPLRCGSSNTSVFTGLEMGFARVGTTSAESGTSSPVDVLILMDTASMCLCNGLVAPNDDKLMFSNLSGVKARLLASFSMRKDRCDPSSNLSVWFKEAIYLLHLHQVPPTSNCPNLLSTSN